MKTRLQGSFVAIVTPFNAAGTVDFGAYAELIGWHREQGTQALFFMGSAGESATLLDAEREQLIARTARLKSAQVPFFYGCTGTSTQHTIERLRIARDNGADGAMLQVPPYLGPSEADAEAYFMEVADAVDLPLGIYNNPARLMTDLRADCLLRLFKHPNYVVYKESTPRTSQIAQLLRAAPDVAIMGSDSPEHDLMTPVLALGGHGVSNGAGNLAPAAMAALFTPWSDAQAAARFRELYLRWLPLFSLTYSARSPVAIKSLMNALGLPAGKLRAPLRELESPQVEAGLRALAELGIRAKAGS